MPWGWLLTGLHILAAIVWVGGMLFLALVLGPLSRAWPEAERARLFQAVGRRFRPIGWTAAAVLVVTGLGQVWLRTAGGIALPTPQFGWLLAVKLLLVGLLLGGQALHDFVWGPQQTALGASLQKQPDGALARRYARLRHRTRLVARLTTFLALAVVLLGAGLRWS